MDLATRKYNIIKRFMAITNIDKIEKLEAFFNSEIEEASEIPNDVKQVLDIGLQQIEEGKTKPASDVIARVKKKYNIAQ